MSQQCVAGRGEEGKRGGKIGKNKRGDIRRGRRRGSSRVWSEFRGKAPDAERVRLRFASKSGGHALCGITEAYSIYLLVRFNQEDSKTA